MYVTLTKAELEGAISSATLTPAIDDGNISFENIRDVGVITETTLTANPFASLYVTLEQDARWVVTKTSYLMSLTIDDSSAVEAQPGYKLEMTVDGVETPIESGSYEGEILIDVLEDENYVPEPSPSAEPEAEAEVAPESTEITPEPSASDAEPEQPEPSAENTDSAQPEPESRGIGTAGVIGIVAGVVIVLGIGFGFFRKTRKQ